MRRVLIAGIVVGWAGLSARAESVDVYILAGQSNMVGLGITSELPPEFQAPQNDVLFNVLHVTNGWTTLRPGGGAEFGPEITFGRHTADLQAPNSIALYKFAVGATSLAVDWDPDAGPLYPQLMQGLRDAVDALRQAGHQPQIKAMLWMQGESDALSADWAAAYETNFTNFISRVRSDVGVEALPFVFGQIYAPTLPFRNVVRAAQARVAAHVPGATMILTDDLPVYNDRLHYNTAGLMGMGYRFAVALNDVNCAAIHRFKAKCREGTLIGKIKSDLPIGTVLSIDRDGEETSILRIGGGGRGRVWFYNQSGWHTIRVLECPEWAWATVCG